MHVVRYHKVYCILLNLQKIIQNQRSKELVQKCSLDKIQKNYEILSTVDGKSYEKLQTILLKKPVKTSSGVAVIALMP